MFLQIRCCSQETRWLSCCASAMRPACAVLPVSWTTWKYARLSRLHAPTAWKVDLRWRWPLTLSMSTSAGTSTQRLACFTVVSLGRITSPSLWGSFHTKTCPWCWWRTETRCRLSSTRRTPGRKGRYELVYTEKMYCSNPESPKQSFTWITSSIGLIVNRSH